MSSQASYASVNAGENISVTIQGFSLSGKDANNYQITTEVINSENGKILPYELVVSFKNDQAISKTFDGTPTVALPENILQLSHPIGSDDVTLIAPAQANFADAKGGIQKEVTVSGLSLSGQDADNYVLKSTELSASIGEIIPRSVTVTASSKIRKYGEADPVFDYTVTGLLDGGKLEGSLEREQGTAVDDYIIQKGTLNGGTDYQIETYEPAVLSITKAPLQISVKSATRRQGQPNPKFELDYTGWVYSDGPASLLKLPVASTIATNSSPIGIYEVTLGGAESSNYELTYSGGTLTVVPGNNQPFSIKAWSSSSDVLQIRIYSDRTQKASIALYTLHGQVIILEPKQLEKGINNHQLQVGAFAQGTYILGVFAEKAKAAEKVRIK